MQSALSLNSPIVTQFQCNLRNSKVEAPTETPTEVIRIIKSNQHPEAISPKLLRKLQEYIKNAFNDDAERSHEEMEGIVNYVFMHHLAFSSNLMAEVLERLTEQPDIKQKLSNECIQKINEYVIKVFNSPEKRTTGLIENAVDYIFVTEADIPDCAKKNVVTYVLDHMATFSDQCIADAVSYVLKNSDLTQCDAPSIRLFVNAMNWLSGAGNAEMFSEEVILTVDKHVEDIISNFGKFDNTVITSAIAYLEVFQPKNWTEKVNTAINTAKIIVKQNDSFFKTPIENQEKFAAVYEKNRQEKEAIGRYTQGLMKALNLYPGRVIRVEHNQKSRRQSFFFIENTTDKTFHFFTNAVKTTDRFSGGREVSIHGLWIEGEFEAAIYANPMLALYIASNEKHAAMTYWNEHPN